MTDFRSGEHLGERLQALRKLRGIKSSKALATLIDSPNVTDAIIHNVEAGRRVDLTISQLLNIALALRVPPIFLLAAIGDPNGPLDLPNLSHDFQDMTVAEFDSWIAGNPTGEYKFKTVSEQSERSQLEALRTLLQSVTERQRLAAALGLESATSPDSPLLSDTERRLADITRQIGALTEYLESAGWETRRWLTSDE